MKMRLWIAAMVALVSFLICVPGFLLLERAANDDVRTLFDAVWWWVVTSATVGYGDIVPVTTAGRVISIVAIITGFYVYTQGISLIAEATHRFIERHQRGIAPLRLRDHIVLCDYTAVADEWIQALQRDPQWSAKPVAVVTDLVQTAPYRHCGFVFGVPLNPEVMRRANVVHASHVIVFANHRFGDPDLKSFHAAIRVHAMAPAARIYVESVNPNSPLASRLPAGIRLLPSATMIEHVITGQGIDVAHWLAA